MIIIERKNPDDPTVESLIKKLDADLWERYPTQQSFFAQFNKLPKEACVVVAYDGKKPVGCGAFKPFTDNEKIVEIKRMYVDESVRNKGIGLRILNALEKWAIEKNYKIANLETGTNQPEAIRLYKKAGYELIENFEPYIGVENSICFGKKLTPVGV
jgi:putative acetyltransferase